MSNQLDQFYTNDNTAKECVQHLTSLGKGLQEWDCIIEPSAGSGSFLRHLPPKTIGIDLDPRHPGIIQGDYLQWTPPSLEAQQSILVIGNPPFGKNASLAVSFFNTSAKFADTIAFIMPRTFRKATIIDRLHPQFHLIQEWVLPPNSFHEPSGTTKSVPTVFQVWSKHDAPRQSIAHRSESHPDWEWVSPQNATHAIRRVGVNAGKLFPLHNASPSSHYFVKAKHLDFERRWNEVWQKYWQSETPSNGLNPKWDVAGNPSLTRVEMVHYYSIVFNTFHNSFANSFHLW